ncbi:MAG TPA: hypothetical protein PK137_07945 [Anaerolineaceae bacterium]|nr:hypothetical protein [Anaerolineaceae bacterium]HPL43755.1 hypothetical protein [Anaerolineaceae bacterium]
MKGRISLTILLVISVLLLSMGQIDRTNSVLAQGETPPVDATLGLEPQPAPNLNGVSIPEYEIQSGYLMLDDFNRPDGALGPYWTIQKGSCNITDNTAVCGNQGIATYNDSIGEGNSAETDVIAIGTNTQYAALVLNYGAGNSNPFLKIQSQDGLNSFSHAACYTGNNGPAFGLGFFELNSPFTTAHMKAARKGSTVTLTFSNVDGGAQPDQVYVCNGAPAPEGDKIGIAGYNFVSRVDNFGISPTVPEKVYLTSLDTGPDASDFAVYYPLTDSWTILNPYDTACQMAVDTSGNLFALNAATHTIDQYQDSTDTWTTVMAGPPSYGGEKCNLEITPDGRFLINTTNSYQLYISGPGGTWSTQTLPFESNLMGDLDPGSGQYVIGQYKTTNAYMLNLNTWAITNFSSPINNGEFARFSSILDGRYYFEAGGSNLHSFNLSQPADPPVDHGISGPWFGSSAADRNQHIIYVASLDASEFWKYDPAANTLTALAPYPDAANMHHSSLAFVGGTGVSADPQALSATLCPNCTGSASVEVCNNRAAELTWALVEMPASGMHFNQGSSFVPAAVSGTETPPEGSLTLASPPTSANQRTEEAQPKGTVLWNQPVIEADTDAYVSQEFPDLPSYSSFLADDFFNGSAWALDTINIPGEFWMGGSSFTNATALTFQIYADSGGIPAGDPSGGGSAPLWTLSIPPTDPQLSFSLGSGGLPSNVTLNLSAPVLVPSGHWWLVFYPTMSFSPGGEWGRRSSDTSNLNGGQFINPGGGFGYGTSWQPWGNIGATQHDIAFRLEGSILQDIPWLSVNPVFGTLPVGTCQTIDVTFDSHGLPYGEYTGTLLIYVFPPNPASIFVDVNLKVDWCSYLPHLLK